MVYNLKEDERILGDREYIREPSFGGLLPPASHLAFLKRYEGYSLDLYQVRSHLVGEWVVDPRAEESWWKNIGKPVIPARPKQTHDLRNQKTEAQQQLEKWQNELNDPNAFLLIVPTGLNIANQKGCLSCPVRPQDLLKSSEDLKNEMQTEQNEVLKKSLEYAFTAVIKNNRF